MSRIWKIVGNYPQLNDYGEYDSSIIQLVTTGDEYATFTVKIPYMPIGTNSDDIIKAALDQFYKEEFADKAVQESVLKVDTLEQRLIKMLSDVETQKNELDTISKNISETDDNLKKSEYQRNIVFDRILSKINANDESVKELKETVNNFINDIMEELNNISKEEDVGDDKPSEGQTENSTESEEHTEHGVVINTDS